MATLNYVCINPEINEFKYDYEFNLKYNKPIDDRDYIYFRLHCSNIKYGTIFKLENIFAEFKYVYANMISEDKTIKIEINKITLEKYFITEQHFLMKQKLNILIGNEC